MKKLTLFISLLMLVGCGTGPEAEVTNGEALGTTYHIKYFSEADIQFEEALDSIFENINNSMSTYRPGSDISRINQGDTTVLVDENFREVFQLSQKIFNESQGYFDPTVGILVNSYGLGPEENFTAPNSTSLDSLRRYVGLDKLTISSENKIRKNDPHIYLDFNAIAKGYTIDVIARYLDAHGVENYLVELGGELVARGKNIKKESAWLVAIDDPEQKEGQRTFQTVLALQDRALATSGNYRKYRIDSLTGQRFVHTINPLTGKAEKSNILSASVLAENCALADGYATAFMALGLEQSKEMLERIEGVDVYLIYAEDNNGQDEMSIFATDGFKEALRD